MDTPFTQKDLDSWVNTNTNVLFEGFHGSGKTTRALETFEKHGIKFKYFSCATLDPWTDLIGIPTIVKENGVDVIHYIKPREFAFDEVECIFLDEFNRAKSKVRNACMEILQFKSVNGKEFNNLRFVWAAINPESKDEVDDIKYDVEKLDPATRDRFQVHIRVPYAPDNDFFAKRFGAKVAKSVIEWWNDLDPAVKFKVSPRRLEYAIDGHNKGLNVKHILPFDANIRAFLTHLQGGSVTDIIKDLFQRRNDIETKQYIDSNKNLLNIVNAVVDDMEYVKYFAPFLPKENLVAKINDSDNVFEFLIRNYAEYTILIGEAVKQRGDLGTKLYNFDINRLLPGFDFSKLTFQSPHNPSSSTYSMSTIIEPKTNIIETKGDSAFNLTIKDAEKILVELIYKESRPNSTFISPNDADKVAKIRKYLEFLIESGASINFPSNFVVLVNRIFSYSIQGGDNNVAASINTSGDRYKAFIIKNLFRFL